jgi:hypothetical protein
MARTSFPIIATNNDNHQNFTITGHTDLPLFYCWDPRIFSRQRPACERGLAAAAHSYSPYLTRLAGCHCCPWNGRAVLAWGWAGGCCCLSGGTPWLSGGTRSGGRREWRPGAGFPAVGWPAHGSGIVCNSWIWTRNVHKISGLSEYRYRYDNDDYLIWRPKMT